jgi:outer membrane protein assembly factor BamD
MYVKARGYLDSANYVKGVEWLEALDSRYPFGPHAQQVQLDLIYAYYKAEDTAQASANVDRFLRLNPTHPNVDYALYLRGLTNQAIDYNVFQDLAGVDRSDRDPSYARQAFKDFRSVVIKYPDSPYAQDARARMIGLKNRLARYELAVADYYMRRKAYVASANRAKGVVETFADVPAREQALVVMIKAYKKLGMPDAAAHATTLLKRNYPKHPLVAG